MEDNSMWDLTRNIIVGKVNNPAGTNGDIWRTLHIMALEIEQLKLENADLKEKVKYIETELNIQGIDP